MSFFVRAMELDGCFPLTPALSRRERVNLSQSWLQSSAHDWSSNGQMVLPLLGERAGVRGNTMHTELGFTKKCWPEMLKH